MEGGDEKKSKTHRASRAGRKHDRKENKSKFSFAENDDKGKETAKKRNPKVPNTITNLDFAPYIIF